MAEFEVAYLPIGVPTFDLESAGNEFEKTKRLLTRITDCVKAPEEMLLTLDKLNAFLDEISPDFIILQNVTFANAAYAGEVAKRFSCPIALWTLPEPVIDGTRLRLNSLTGAYSAANMFRHMGVQYFTYIFGSPGEEQVQSTLASAVSAAKVLWQMRGIKIATVGHTPDGFGFGRALDTELLRNFHVGLQTVEVRELERKAREFSDSDAEEYLKLAEQKICGLDKIPEDNRLDFARLYRAYLEFVQEHGIAALSSRCWPDFFVSYGTPVCAALGMLNDLGVAAACEADTYGALSMYIGQQLSGQPVFFGDPVSVNQQENTITYWHCGTAACSLAREDTKAMAGVHCNRKIGPTLEFGCRACEHVTVFRIGRKPDGTFRFFILEGEALDKPQQFYGTSVVVKVKSEAMQVVNDSVQAGFEPHFCVIYGDCAQALEILGGMLQMEVCKF